MGTARAAGRAVPNILQRNSDFRMADDDSAARPDHQFHRWYTEYDRSTGGPDGIRNCRT